MQFNRLEFTTFPRTWGIITIPENFVVYRGGTREPLLSTDPRFFSDFQTADMYSKMQPNYNTYACCTNELKLIDLRTLRYLFLEYVGYNKLLFGKEELGLINKIIFALGLIPIKNQLEYIQNNADTHTGLYHWKNKYPDEGNITDIEYDIRCNYEEIIGSGPMPMNFEENISYYMNFGNRISECSIDDYMVGLLKIIFQDTIDGYIAPRLETVWHNFNFHPELCLFNPSKSLQLCTKVPSNIDPDAHIPPINIGTLLGIRVIADYDMMLGGEGNNNEHTVCKKNDKFQYFKEIKHNFANEEDTKEKNIEIVKHWHILETKSESEIESKSVPIVPFFDIFNKNSPVLKSQVKSQVKKIQENTRNENTRKGIQYDLELF